MKHFQDEENDSMKEYEFSIMHHDDDQIIDEEDSTVFSHWLEDDGYDDYGPTIKHFQDD